MAMIKNIETLDAWCPPMFGLMAAHRRRWVRQRLATSAPDTASGMRTSVWARRSLTGRAQPSRARLPRTKLASSS